MPVDSNHGNHRPCSSLSFFFDQEMTEVPRADNRAFLSLCDLFEKTIAIRERTADNFYSVADVSIEFVVGKFYRRSCADGRDCVRVVTHIYLYSGPARATTFGRPIYFWISRHDPR